jgi:hypothetical protein
MFVTELNCEIRRIGLDLAAIYRYGLLSAPAGAVACILKSSQAVRAVCFCKNNE